MKLPKGFTEVKGGVVEEGDLLLQIVGGEDGWCEAQKDVAGLKVGLFKCVSRKLTLSLNKTYKDTKEQRWLVFDRKGNNFIALCLEGTRGYQHAVLELTSAGEGVYYGVTIIEEDKWELVEKKGA